MTRMMPLLFAIACLAFPAALRAEPELLPQPRIAESQVHFAKMTGGYQVTLTRKAAETLRDLLPNSEEGKKYSELIKQAAKDLNDPDSEKKLEMLAFVVKSQAPALKKSLTEKMGPSGATIRVYGLENKVLPDPPPLVKALGEAFIPSEIKDMIKTGTAVIGTTPLHWKVEGRK